MITKKCKKNLFVVSHVAKLVSLAQKGKVQKESKN